MAKRLTDSNKWQDPWFADLSPSGKLLWLYLVDACDGMGVVKIHPRLISATIGINVDLVEFENQFIGYGKVLPLDGERFWIPGFLRHQYRTFSEKNAAHKNIARNVAKIIEVIGWEKLRQILSTDLCQFLSQIESIGTTSPSLARPSDDPRPTLARGSSEPQRIKNKENRKENKEKEEELEIQDTREIDERFLPIHPGAVQAARMRTDDMARMADLIGQIFDDKPNPAIESRTAKILARFKHPEAFKDWFNGGVGTHPLVRDKSPGWEFYAQKQILLAIGERA